jgi:hypothetical protein
MESDYLILGEEARTPRRAHCQRVDSRSIPTSTARRTRSLAVDQQLGDVRVLGFPQ